MQRKVTDGRSAPSARIVALDAAAACTPRGFSGALHFLVDIEMTHALEKNKWVQKWGLGRMHHQPGIVP
jgi:hypothetical protein